MHCCLSSSKDTSTKNVKIEFGISFKKGINDIFWDLRAFWRLGLHQKMYGDIYNYLFFILKHSLQLLQVFSENLQERRLSICMKLWSCDRRFIFCLFITYNIKCFMCHVCWKKEGGHTLLFLESLLLQTKSKHFIHEICMKIYRNDKKKLRNLRKTFGKNKYLKKNRLCVKHFTWF